MSDLLHQIESASLEMEAAPLGSESELETYRLAYLSRNGLISRLFDDFRALPGPEKASVGKRLNAFKTRTEERYETARQALAQAAEQRRDIREDLSLPVAPTQMGSFHPLTLVQNEIKGIFHRMGFTVSDGPEIEDDFHNFTALNFPADHPARDMQDTFFIRKGEQPSDDLVLRTHTSPVQIRLMREQAPPIRSVMPGRVYRNESVTYKSYFQFNQIEGLVVDESVSMADLIHTLVTFAKMLYGESVDYRIRTSFFPFTEPSIEMDVRTSPDKSWLEILGAGMVDPNVLAAVGLDPERYSGYAFGMGIDRMAMLKYGFTDIRTLYENDVRMLSQFT